MNVNEMFPSKYLAAHDLQGRDCQLQIAGVAIEDLGQGAKQERKPVIYFAGCPKGLVLNRTNANVISGMYGEESDAWIGQSITLYPTTTEMAGETKQCIRVRQGMPAAQQVVAMHPQPTMPYQQFPPQMQQWPGQAPPQNQMPQQFTQPGEGPTE